MKVIELTKENFTETIHEKKLVFIYFGHYSQDNYEQMIPTCNWLVEKVKSATICFVDTMIETDLAKEYKAEKDTPLFIIFKDGGIVKRYAKHNQPLFFEGMICGHT